MYDCQWPGPGFPTGWRKTVIDLLVHLVNTVLHIDKYLDLFIRNYGIWTHLFLFIIICCETGFVVMPFLPGDSLLFAAGSFCALGSLDIAMTVVSLIVAAVVGDTVNYWAGRKTGPRVFSREASRFFKKHYLEQTHAFYVRHGGKTIIIARFIPIIRTFAPFVAGIGSMAYGKFLCYNVIGGVSWTVGFVLMGYLFGNIPIVKQQFGLVIVAIIVFSIMPVIIGYFRNRLNKRI